jgi:hypothetical protein
MSKIQVMTDSYGMFVADPETVKSVIWDGTTVTVDLERGPTTSMFLTTKTEARAFYEGIVGQCYPKAYSSIGDMKDLLGSYNPKA